VLEFSSSDAPLSIVPGAVSASPQGAWEEKFVAGSDELGLLQMPYAGSATILNAAEKDVVMEGSKSNATASASVRFNLSLRRAWVDVHQEVVDFWAEHIIVQVAGYGAPKAVRSATYASLANTNEDALQHSWTLLHPGGLFRLTWNALSLFLILYDVLMMPMSVFGVGEGSFFEVLEWLFTIFWTLDVLLTFRTGFFIGAHVELRPAQIARHYATTWLPVDVAVVVIEWVGRFTEVIGSASLLRTSRIFRTFRFIKLLRLAKLKALWNALKEQINSNFFHLCINITIMTLAILVAIHLVSCAWYGIGSISSDGWIHQEIYEGRKDLLFWYLASARWSIAQLNGRTDLDDRRNMLERGFTCLAGIILAVIAKSVFTSVLTKTVLELSDLHSESNRRRRLVNEYLERHGVSAILVANVKRCLNDFQDVEKEHRNENAVLEILPKHVQGSLLCEVRSPVLLKHSLFQGIASASHAAIRHLCRAAVRPVSAARGEVVFEKGDACSRMLVVHEGCLMYGQPWGGSHTSDLEEINDGDSASGDSFSQQGLPPVRYAEMLQHGTWVSEPALFVSWTNQGKLIADSLSYMYSIEVADFAQVLVKHLEAYANVVLYGREFVRQLNAESSFRSDLPKFHIHTTGVKRCERTWYVTIMGASGLRNADFFLMGTSDPYCICKVHGVKRSSNTLVKTDVISNTTSPTWNQSFELSFHGEHPFEFQIWDKDMFPKQDELLGYASLSSSQIVDGTFVGDLPLEGSKATGFLKIRVSTIPPSEV
jgi:hypothetical protein